MSNCNYRYCNKELTYGRPDRKFCNKNCKSKEESIIKELKSLKRKYEMSKSFKEKSSIKHNNKYIYDLVIYNTCRDKVKIICPEHGVFEQTPDSHLYSGSGCIECSKHRINELTSDRINRFNESHGEYLYNDINITNSKINVYCELHGTFSVNIYDHEYGLGCSKCNMYETFKNEMRVKLKDIEYIENYSFKDCKNIKQLRFDFYIPSENKVIDYRGRHHFLINKYYGISNIKKYIRNDKIKEKYCLDNNIELIIYNYKNDI
jgi:hypothetical protein